MKARRATFPELRREFKSQYELAEVINKSRSYVNDCMNGRKEFTDVDWKCIERERKIRLLMIQVEALIRLNEQKDQTILELNRQMERMIAV